MSSNGLGPRDPGASFPRTVRLRKRPEYQAIQQYGRRHPARDIIVLWQEGRTAETRLGVTVSRRVAKQAARRNQIKRWIREAFRRLPDRSTRRSLDIVVIARSQAVRSTYADVQAQLTTFWTKVEAEPPRASRPRRTRRPRGPRSGD